MKALVCAISVLVLAAPASSGARYDRKLEEAAAAIVAARMGDIRGSFAFGVRPTMVVVRDDIVMSTTEIADPPEGMTRATERRTATSTTF